MNENKLKEIKETREAIEINPELFDYSFLPEGKFYNREFEGFYRKNS